MSWKIIDNVPNLTYYPNGPKGDYITLIGECKPEDRLSKSGYKFTRYEPTERDICGREITVILQLEINDETNGIRVWFNDSGNNTWYWQSSHFKNTLLNDVEFDALISPLLKNLT